AMIAGGVALAVALLDGGIAIYTFKHYSSLQADARRQLDTIRTEAWAQDPVWTKQNDSYFTNKPDCNVPSGGPSAAGYNQFKATCDEGSRWATITTVLDIGVGVLAAIGITSLSIGLYQSKQGAEKPKMSLAPRLKLLSPVVTTTGGGLSAAFEF